MIQANVNIPKSAKGIEKEASGGQMFISQAQQIEPDSYQMPSAYEAGPVENSYPRYAGGIIQVVIHKNGTLLTMRNPEGGLHYEWFSKGRKGDAFMKAKLLARAASTAKLFRDD
jgi:hypothetical protein